MPRIKVRRKKLETKTERKKEMVWNCFWFKVPSEVLDFLNANNLSPEDCHVTIDSTGLFWVFYLKEKGK